MLFKCKFLVKKKEMKSYVNIFININIIIIKNDSRKKPHTLQRMRVKLNFEKATRFTHKNTHFDIHINTNTAIH